MILQEGAQGPEACALRGIPVVQSAVVNKVAKSIVFFIAYLFSFVSDS